MLEAGSNGGADQMQRPFLAGNLLQISRKTDEERVSKWRKVSRTSQKNGLQAGWRADNMKKALSIYGDECGKKRSKIVIMAFAFGKRRRQGCGIRGGENHK